MNITIFIIILTALISILGWQNKEVFDKLKLNPYMVFHKKEYYRILGHALLHADWMHLIFNMFTLFVFGSMVEEKLKIYFNHELVLYILLYSIGAIIAALPSIIKHKNDHWYNSIGASGAVAAVLFAGIFFEPLMGISLYLIPIPIPGILFGIAYLAYSQYMSRKSIDNINHDAHFAGAIFGFIFPILLKPELFKIFLEKLFNQY
jgi:membrane associated rhomboid family serine protease